MPWAPRAYSPIRLGVLKSALENEGLECRTHNLFLGFAEKVGGDLYDRISMMPEYLFLGEWLFAAKLHNQGSANEYLDHLANCHEQESSFLQDESPGPLNSLGDPRWRETLLHIRNEVAPEFLSEELNRLESAEVDVVGFTCVVNQLAPSLAMARLWKERRPDALIVLGGASVQGEMGKECVRAFPWVDVVVDGEGEEALPELVRYHRTSRAETTSGTLPRGIFVRQDGTVTHTGDRAPIRDLDRFPPPDYSEYFQELGARPTAAPPVLWVQIESSRGCWWGEKRQCSFCGVNGRYIGYRSKSPGRVLLEIVKMSGAYRQNRLYLVDTVAGKSLLTEVLPALRDTGYDLSLFLEVRPTTGWDELLAMRDAGVTIVQPGIESFSSEALRAMRKGTDAMHNIRFLRWCRELGIDVAYNLLWGVPGESPIWYEQMAGLFPSLVHLAPPDYPPSQIVYQRHSPYFNEAVARGTTLTPQQDYRYIYGENVDLRALAFLFEYPGLDQFGNAFYIRPVAGAVRDWRKRYYSANRPILSFSHGLNFVKISDSRLGKADEYVLSGPAASVFLCCQEIRSRRSIGEAIGNSWNGSCEAAEIDDILAELVRGRLLYCENDRYLSLAIPERAIRREVGFLASSILKRS
jgi:ribosomal peptide maturation radical SAM protein 1